MAQRRVDAAFRLLTALGFLVAVDVMSNDDHKFEATGPSEPEREPRKRIGPKPLTLPHEGEENEFGLVDPSQFTKKQLKENEKAIRQHKKDPYEWNREPDKPEPKLSNQTTFVVYVVDIDRTWHPVSEWLNSDAATEEVERQLSIPHRYGLTHVGLVNWRYEVDPRKLPKIEKLDNFWLDKDQSQSNNPNLIFSNTYPIRKR